MLELGKDYEDRITGFVGTATAHTVFLFDSPSIRLERADENGRPEDVWFAEERLAPAEPKTKKVGLG